MSVCILDKDNYCERHSRIHKGRELELALLNDERGEKYRLYWDEKMKPNFAYKVAGFVSALAKHVFTGMKNVSDEEYNRRISICDTCKMCDKSEDRWVCLKCGCYLREPGKARWAEQRCPLKMWGESEIKKGGCGCNTPK